MDAAESKQCTMCKEVKPLQMFKKNPKKDGRQSECASCKRILAATYQNKRKQEREYLLKLTRI